MPPFPERESVLEIRIRQTDKVSDPIVVFTVIFFMPNHGLRFLIQINSHGILVFMLHYLIKINNYFENNGDML